MSMSFISDLLYPIYSKYVSPYLPNKISVHNGVAVADELALLDVTDVFQDYEAPLVGAIRNHIQNEDEIIIVGGGIGVSTVAAVEATGRTGHVTVYEAVESRCQTIRKTAELNCVQNYVTIKHSIVATYSQFSSEFYGEPGDPDRLSSSMFPSCDVLVLDCEGAELDVLSELEINPRCVIVEIHEFLDVAESEIREQLTTLGYNIISKETEDINKGVHVLTAVRDG